MFYRIIILASLLVSISQVSQAQGYDLNFKIEGLEDSTAFLGYHFGQKKYVTDTSDIVDGKIHFADEQSLAKGIYFLYSKSFYMEFVITHAEQRFTIDTKKTAMYDGIKIKGSTENEIFAAFQERMSSLGRESKALRDQLSAEGLSKADSTKIIDKVAAIERKSEDVKKDFREKNSGSFLSALLYLMQKPEPPAFEEIEDPKERARKQFYHIREHYFDHIDLADSGLIRTPVYHNRILDYVNKFTIQHPDSIFKSIKLILDGTEPSRELFRYWAVNFTSEYQNPKIMGMDKVFVLLAEQYYLKGKFPWVKEDVIEKVEEEVRYLRPTLLESIAPQFQVQDTLDQDHRLYDLRNDYVVLFFYSPTCGHCKKKAPVVLEAYKKLQEDNIDIALWGVCTETDREKWIEFIKEKKLEWTNLADLKYKSNFRADYNVRTTPTIVVLDRDKKVIAKKLDAEQIEQFVRDQIVRDKAKKTDQARLK